MKNKKIMITIVAAALVAIIGVGATLAYFTDNDEVQNVLTLGAVDIDLDEPNYKGDEAYENIVPGDVIEKDPTITLASDSEEAYVLNVMVPHDVHVLPMIPGGMGYRDVVLERIAGDGKGRKASDLGKEIPSAL